MFKSFLSVFLYMLFFTSSLALAQDTAAVLVSEPSPFNLLVNLMSNFPEVTAWLVAIFTFLGVMLRAISEILAFVSSKLGKSDKGWAQKLSDYSMFCAKVVGWFGGGVSQKIIDQKVAAAQEKAS